MVHQIQVIRRVSCVALLSLVFLSCTEDPTPVHLSKRQVTAKAEESLPASSTKPIIGFNTKSSPEDSPAVQYHMGVTMPYEGIDSQDTGWYIIGNTAKFAVRGRDVGITITLDPTQPKDVQLRNLVIKHCIPSKSGRIGICHDFRYECRWNRCK